MMVVARLQRTLNGRRAMTSGRRGSGAIWPTMRRGRTFVPHMQHVARVLASPLKGVYSTHIDSGHEFGRHWHDTYGFGFLEHGAQEWFSGRGIVRRSEEHTSELQSQSNLVCRLLLEKKKQRTQVSRQSF